MLSDKVSGNEMENPNSACAFQFIPDTNDRGFSTDNENASSFRFGIQLNSFISEIIVDN